jgi:hypothetical protein
MLSFAVYSQVSLRTGSRVPAPSTYGPLVRSSCTLSRLRPVTPLESNLKAHSRFSPNSAEITRSESIRDFAKSFKAHSYEKYARKSFRAHSYEIAVLKAPSNHTLTKKRGGGRGRTRCQVASFFWHRLQPVLLRSPLNRTRHTMTDRPAAQEPRARRPAALPAKARAFTRPAAHVE